MPHQKSIILLLFVAASLGISSGAMAVMESSDKDESVRKLGVAWNIADDRKMENIAGIYQPEGLDKYMKRYFDECSAKIDELSMRIGKLSEQVAQMDMKINTLGTKKETEKATPQSKIV